MAFLSRITSRAKYLDVRPRPGLTSHLVETGEYLGVSYLAARINTQYGDKAKYNDVELTFAGGVAGKLLAVVADIAGYGGPGATLIPHLNTISNALIATHLAAKGAADGLAAAAPKGPSKALPGGKTQSLGYVPPAPQPGKFLNLAEVQRVASMHG